STLGVILMRLRITEVDQNAVAHVFRDKATEAAHSFRNALLVPRNYFAQILRVHARRQRCRANEVREHYGDLAALCGIARLRLWPGDGFNYWLAGPGELADGCKHDPSMPEQHANLFEV